MQVCPVCSEENPEVARFCHACGASLSSETPREERKVVSVLFADLVGGSRGRCLEETLVTAVWVVIAALALATAALKLAGPLALGGRPLPDRALSVVELLASALLAALVVVETFGKGRSLTVDARVLGAAFAVLAVWRRAPMLGAAAVTAAARLLS